MGRYTAYVRIGRQQGSRVAKAAAVGSEFLDRRVACYCRSAYETNVSKKVLPPCHTLLTETPFAAVLRYVSQHLATTIVSNKQVHPQPHTPKTLNQVSSSNFVHDIKCKINIHDHVDNRYSVRRMSKGKAGGRRGRGPSIP